MQAPWQHCATPPECILRGLGFKSLRRFCAEGGGTFAVVGGAPCYVLACAAAVRRSASCNGGCGAYGPHLRQVGVSVCAVSPYETLFTFGILGRATSGDIWCNSHFALRLWSEGPRIVSRCSGPLTTTLCKLQFLFHFSGVVGCKIQCLTELLPHSFQPALLVNYCHEHPETLL